MLSKRSLSLFSVVCVTGMTQAAVVSVTGYSYSPNPTNPNYLDSTGSELTDGVTDTLVWPDPSTNFAPLVGWIGVDPIITVDFGSIQTIQTVSVWAADSDGSAGVNLPATVRIRTLDGITFNQLFNVTNPAGSGTTVRLDFTGFSVTADTLVIEAARPTPANTWTMLSEIQFDSVPEPSSLALAGIAGFGLLRRRR